MKRNACAALLTLAALPVFAQSHLSRQRRAHGGVRHTRPDAARRREVDVQGGRRRSSPRPPSPTASSTSRSLDGHLYADRPGDGQGEVELQVEDADRVLAGGRRTARSTSCRRSARSPRSTSRPASRSGCSPRSTRGSSRRRTSTATRPRRRRSPTRGTSSPRRRRSPNGKVYFGSGDGNVYAVDAETGLLQWKFATEGRRARLPGRRRQHRLHRKLGQPPLRDRRRDRPAEVVVQGGRGPRHPQPGRLPVLARGRGRHGVRGLPRRPRLRARRRDRPQEVGLSDEQVVGDRHARRCGTASCTSGTSDSARFMALDAKTGRLRFNFDAKAYVFSSAALAGDLVYVGDHNGKLYAIDAKTGKLAWEFRTEASKADPMKVLNPDGSLNQEAFAPMFGDFEDMYIDFYRFVSIGAIMSSPVVDRGVGVRREHGREPVRDRVELVSSPASPRSCRRDLSRAPGTRRTSAPRRTIGTRGPARLPWTSPRARGTLSSAS